MARRHAPRDEVALADTEPQAASHVRAFADTGNGLHAAPVEAACVFVRNPEDASAWGGKSLPPLVWIDITNPGQPEAALLRDQLGFHPLAVEDSLRGRQRPKLDRYAGYYFMVLYAARLNTERNRMALNEVHLFLGRHYIVTVHDHKIGEFTEVMGRWRAAPAEFRSVGAVTHAVLDTIVDDYFPMIDHFSERVEELEGSAFTAERGGAMQDILTLRRELTLFRKVVSPERDLMGTLLRRDLPFLSPDLLLYFQDVHDHVLRVVEEIDTLRDLLSTALEGQLSLASNQLNVTMRVMAAWSIILMAVTLVAGIYGMNFHHMPELALRWGYAWALGLMLAIGAVLYGYFHRRGWL